VLTTNLNIGENGRVG